MKTLESLMSDAVENYDRAEYGKCAFALAEAIPLVEACGEWLRASELYCLSAKCDAALGRFEMAARAYQTAVSILEQLPDYPDGQLELVKCWQREVLDDKQLREELAKLHRRVLDHFNHDRVVQAESLCRSELVRAEGDLGQNHWFVGAVNILLSSAVLQSLVWAVEHDAYEALEDAAGQLRLAARLKKHAESIFQTCPLRSAWLNPWLTELARRLDFTKSKVNHEDVGAFTPSDEWTPESEDTTARRPGTLTNWREPFSTVSFKALRPELIDRLQPADDLFTRGEYDQCLELTMNDIALLATRTGSEVLGSLTLVLAVRCRRALGHYEHALSLLSPVVGWAGRTADIGHDMLPDLQRLQQELEDDHERQTMLRHVQLECDELFDKRLFDKAVVACQVYFERFCAQEGHDEEHWLCSGVTVLRVDAMVRKLEQSNDMERAVAVELLQDADALLRGAEKNIRRQGHRVPWLNAWEVAPLRERLDTLMAKYGL